MAEDDVAQIVHDLKNPLGAIALEATLLDSWISSGDSVRGARSIARIQDNVTYLDRVVHDLLDVCAASAGQLRLSKGPVELSAVLDQVVSRLGGKLQERVIIDATGPVVLSIDDVRIQRVVANLVDNALRYSHDTANVVITLRGSATRARITVVDSGPGIAPDDLPTLFEPYRRGRSVCRSGSGIGLYACKRIVEAHGGVIGVESFRHVGSRFYVELPRS